MGGMGGMGGLMGGNAGAGGSESESDEEEAAQTGPQSRDGSTEQLRRLGRSAAHSIDEEGPELVAPIFVNERPHSALVPNTRVVDARFGLGGMLLGYMTEEGKCVGNVEGGLKESRGIGARVIFDE
jgi:hypothetical protein